MEIRNATSQDAAGINRIYNWYVQHTAITFDIEDWDLDRRRHWIAQFDAADNDSGMGTQITAQIVAQIVAQERKPRKNHQLLVGLAHGQVIGFAYNGAFRSRAAYSCSTEVTIYLDHEQHGKGYGKQLYTELFDRIAKTDLHRAYAIIALPNEGSIKLHEYFGFQHLGMLSEVGSKFGQYHDVAWMEKRLDLKS